MVNHRGGRSVRARSTPRDRTVGEDPFFDGGPAPSPDDPLWAPPPGAG